MAYKQKALYTRSLDKFKALGTPVTSFFGTKAAAKVDETAADQFRLKLAERLAPATQRERLTTLNACWNWAVKQKLLTENPWTEVLKRVKVPPKQKPQPFTKEEARAILEGFRQSKLYSHYADFVEFLLSTGCRLGEAIGLQWQNLSDDCTKVWIGESMARGGQRKSTKTNRAREFKLSPALQTRLRARYSSQSPDSLVFPAPKGGHIDDHNFSRRAWRSVLTAAAVKYRHPYNCRHTFISHALGRGIPPMAIAEMTGHDPKVLFSRYAADISGGVQVPDLFGES
jgi:integrase